MIKKNIGLIILTASIITTNLNIIAFADVIKTQSLNNKVISSNKNLTDEKENTMASIKKFNLLNTDLEKYNEVFKMKSSNIESITNNGGKYGSSTLNKSIDGDISTHWETGKPNSDLFKNEIIFKFKNKISLNRIIYGARQDGAKGKGFAKKVEIYGSLNDETDDFKLIATGEYSGSVNDIVEIKFKTNEFKRIKFKFVQANANWASASEFMFYKEDSVSDKMDRLFTDNTMSAVSEEFNSIEKINDLDKEVKNHPLYKDFKENIENAKILIQDDSNIESQKAQIQKFEKVNGKYEEDYNKAFKLNNLEIEKISSNDGSNIDELMRAFDDSTQTYWTSKKQNNDNFKNEITVQLKEATILDRLIYGGTPGWQKGYAEEFEIYASNTTKGDTFKLVATGEQPASHDIKEITFNPTEFKRIKFVFKKGNLNQAAASVFWLFKEDKLPEIINNIFTDGTMVKLKDAYNNIDAINDLEKEVNKHPLKHQLIQPIELAKEILQSDKDYSESTFIAVQNGDTHSKAKDTLLMSSFGNDFQSTGIVAKPGEVFNIFVEAEDGKPLPTIVFSQQEGHYGNWRRNYQLKKGMNTIVVPEIYSEEWSRKSAKGGAVYIVNKYTKDQQGKAPVVRIDGGEKFPLFNTGDNQEEFLKELKEYKKKLDENQDTMVDIFEFNTKRLMLTGTAKAAYQVYVNEGVDIEKSIDTWNNQIQQGFDFAGLKDDLNNTTNDSTNVRTAIRLMQPYGAAYAGSDHIGVQRHIQEIILRTDKNSMNSIIWGTMHEVGHQMDIKPRTWGEITNNMWANYAAINNGKGDGVPYNDIYNMLGPEESTKGFESFDYGQKLAMFWQLQLKKNTYWQELESMYRKRVPKPKDYQEKKDILATYSSEVIGMNLTHYFEKYGFNLSEECKNDLKRLPESNEKIWYLNTKAMKYTGNGFINNDTDLEVSLSKIDTGIKISMDINENTKADLLGYEILKNGEVIGFTSGNSYIDTNANHDENIKYEVVPYAVNLKTGDKIEINSFAPSINIQQDVLTLALSEEFDQMSYVKVTNHIGENITSKVKVEHNVNTNKQGVYEVKYIIADEGMTTEKVVKVEVVSKYDYLSDSKWKSVTTQWDTPRKNTNLKGRVNGDIKDFTKGFGIHANGKITYNLSDKDYDNFEALLGVDMGIKANNKSSIRFKIVGDGKILATTNILKHTDNMVAINVPVKGVEELVIEINDGGNGNSSDHAVIANPKLTTNNAKPELNVEDKIYNIGEKVDIMDGVTAHDAEDGDLTSNINVISNNYKEGTIGRFEVVYRISDSNNNVVEKKIYIIIYEDFKLDVFNPNDFSNYNKELNIPVSSVENNAGHYGNSLIGNVIDNNLNTHWETNKPNSNTFKNEVIFNLGNVFNVGEVIYTPRKGGKGFATKFEIYISDKSDGDDFILAGKGEYNGNYNNTIKFDLNRDKVSRIKFKFLEANQDWAAIGELAIYKKENTNSVTSLESNVMTSYMNGSNLIIDGTFLLEGTVVSSPENRELIIKDTNNNIIETIKPYKADWGKEDTGFQAMIEESLLNKLKDGEYRLFMAENVDVTKYEVALKSNSKIYVEKDLNNYNLKLKSLDDGAIQLVKSSKLASELKANIKTVYWDNDAFVINSILDADGESFSKEDDRYLLIKDLDGNEIQRIKAVSINWYSNNYNNYNGIQVLIPKEMLIKLELGSYNLYVEATNNGNKYTSKLKCNTSLLKYIISDQIDSTDAKYFESKKYKFSKDTNDNSIKLDVSNVAAYTSKVDMLTTYFNGSDLVIDGTFNINELSYMPSLSRNLIIKDSKNNEVESIEVGKAGWGEINTGFQAIIRNNVLDKLKNGTYSVFIKIDYDNKTLESPIIASKDISLNSTEISINAKNGDLVSIFKK